jgi:SEC-C motif-containing protein
MGLCPCGSELQYEKCCKRYHDGSLPATALELMRSRYSAYAKHDADYIMSTTHPKNPSFTSLVDAWRQDILDFCTQASFDKLDILEFKEDQKFAYVTFIAKIKHNGHDTSFKEKSRFEKVNGQWLYLDGAVSPHF